MGLFTREAHVVGGDSKCDGPQVMGLFTREAHVVGGLSKCDGQGTRSQTTL